MTTQENMFYGFGKVLLALALADGKLDRSELKYIKEQISKIDNEKHIDLTIIDIVFHEYKKHGTSLSAEELLNSGLKEFHLGDQALTHQFAALFREIIQGLSQAEQPAVKQEFAIMDEFLIYLKKREQEVTGD